MNLTQTIEWHPIETVPKTLEEVFNLYTARNPNDFNTHLLIARANELRGNDELGGCVAECELTPEGKWGYSTSARVSELFGHGPSYSYIHNPTHWALLPSPPTLP